MADSVAYRPTTPRPWLAAYTLCARELVRFFRQPNRVLGAIGQPLIFWILFGAGMSSFRMQNSGNSSPAWYREYYFPGTIVLIILFTAIFATISIIEDRREGFLQSVLVAPLPRWSMVLGKLLGGTLIALIQAAIFLVLGLTLGLRFSPLTLGAIVLWLFVISLALTTLGFVIAWRMDSTQGFHAIMSVFLMPMWLLSGAFFPAPDNWLGWIIRLNPLTYGVAGLRRLLYWNASEPVPAGALPSELPAAWLCGLVMVGFTLLLFAAAWRISARRTTGDLL
ncbi:MAG TPA: ABC transporter permease [Pirellulales bacterium]|nr:ABC transporter permease [Pirellulales bacterium]